MTCTETLIKKNRSGK